jgi:hypothetical protein
MHQHMNMIRHHAPREQLVALVVKVKHGILRNPGDVRVTQMTFANPTIQILLQLCALLAVVLDLQQMLPFTATGFGHGVSHAESDELNQTGKVTMRQITALVPAEEAEGFFFIRKRTLPTVLIRNKFTQIFAFRFRVHEIVAPGTVPARRETH